MLYTEHGLTSQTPQRGMDHQTASDPSDRSASQADQQKIRAQLRKWQERLLDLTKSNPLLGLNRSRVSKLQVGHPSATDLFTWFVLGDAELRMPLVRRDYTAPDQSATSEKDKQPEPRLQVEPGDIEFVESPADVMRRLRRIYDNARSVASSWTCKAW